MATDPLLEDEATPATPQALKILTDMVKAHDKLLSKQLLLTLQLEVVTKSASNIIDKDIPAYMNECGISEVKISDGRAVNCVTKTFGSIKKDDRAKAHEWLRKNGHGGLIKNTVTVTFGQDESGKAAQLEESVYKKGYGVVRAEAVNTQTFSAWVREMTEEGKRMPSKLFGIFTKEVVKISAATKKR